MRGWANCPVVILFTGGVDVVLVAQAAIETGALLFIPQGAKDAEDACCAPLM